MGEVLILLLTVALAGIGFWLHRQEKLGAKRVSPPSTARASLSADEPLRTSSSEAPDSEAFFEAVRVSPFDALHHLERGDFDSARLALQKLSYLVYEQRNEQPLLRVQFTELMCKFARIDPVYQLALANAKAVVNSSPGVLQTALYKRMLVSKEETQYMLYFAHETGDLVRKKKGRTYAIFLPDQVAAETLRQTVEEALEKVERRLAAAERAKTMPTKRKNIAAARQALEDAMKEDLPPELRELLERAGQTLYSVEGSFELDSPVSTNI